MKYIAIIFFACLACNQKQPSADQTNIDTVYLPVDASTALPKIDTVFVVSPSVCDSLYFKSQYDSLRIALLVEQYRIERVKYYLAIVDRNPTQLKFLRSWIRRAVN